MAETREPLVIRGEFGRWLARRCPDLNCGGMLQDEGDGWLRCDGLTHDTDDGELRDCHRTEKGSNHG
jgi:hypothetical protein